MSERDVFKRSIGIVAVTMLLLGAVAAPALAAPPANDDRGAATVIGSLPFDDSIDTSEATPQANDPDCASDVNNPTVWYSFTPNETRRYRAFTDGSDYDTTLLVARVGSGGLDVIDCNDDFNDLTSQVTWRGVAGQEYLIMAGACCGDDGGSLQVHVRRAPPRVNVTVSIDARGIVNRMGGAVVRGHLSCRNGANAEGGISVRVRQTAGRFFIRGFGERGLRCNRDWRVRARGDIGRFAPGRATVAVEATACNGSGCDTDTERRTVRLVKP